MSNKLTLYNRDRAPLIEVADKITVLNGNAKWDLSYSRNRDYFKRYRIVIEVLGDAGSN